MSGVSLILKFAKYIMLVIALIILYYSVEFSIIALKKNEYQSTLDYVVTLSLVFYFFGLIVLYLYRKIIVDDTVIQAVLWTILINGVSIVVFYIIIAHIVFPMTSLPIEIPVEYFKDFSPSYEQINFENGTITTINLDVQKVVFSFCIVMLYVTSCTSFMIYKLYKYRDLLTFKNVFRNNL
uniref:hypothetical protein n=1 Tax=uncultured Tenacibaculum sp. TaxID=174713 RepID=UPI0026092262|nr:hypothetical protein [uncultured Tenacibaculum sp.]